LLRLLLDSVLEWIALFNRCFLSFVFSLLESFLLLFFSVLVMPRLLLHASRFCLDPDPQMKIKQFASNRSMTFL